MPRRSGECWIQCVQSVLLAGGLSLLVVHVDLALVLSFLSQPLKNIFLTANYKAFPTLSLNTGLDHFTLCWFLLREHSSEAESGPCSSRQVLRETGGAEWWEGVFCFIQKTLPKPKGAMRGWSAFMQSFSLRIKSVVSTCDIFSVPFLWAVCHCYTDDIRICRLSLLKALLSNLYLVFFQDAEVALSPLLINFVAHICLPYKFLWHQGLGLNKLIPHFQCMWAWHWADSLRAWNILTHEESKYRGNCCSASSTCSCQAPGLSSLCQCQWGIPKVLPQSVGFCSRCQLWHFSEVPVFIHCVRFSP